MRGRGTHQLQPSLGLCQLWLLGSRPCPRRGEEGPGVEHGRVPLLSEPRFPRRWQGRAAVPAWWGYPEIQAGVRFIILGGWELHGVQMVRLRSNSLEDLG